MTVSGSRGFQTARPLGRRSSSASAGFSIPATRPAVVSGTASFRTASAHASRRASLGSRASDAVVVDASDRGAGRSPACSSWEIVSSDSSTACVEGVPVRVPVEAVDVPRRQTHPDPVGQLGHFLHREIAEGDLPATGGVEPHPLPFLVVEIGPTRDDQQEVLLVESLRHGQKRPARVGVGPVEILDHDDQQIAIHPRRQVLEQLESCGERRRGLHRGQLVDQVERHGTRVLVSGGPDDLTACGQGEQGLAHQGGLARARIPLDPDRPRGSAAGPLGPHR